MVVMRLVLFVLLAGCWRGGTAASTAIAPQPQPLSFVVQVNGLADLHRSTAALAPRLEGALQRVLALANEAERDVLRDELRTITDDVEQLAVHARTARARGGNTAVLADIDRQLADAVVALTKLRHGLRFANTLESLQAYQPVEPTVRRHIGVADFNRP
jgi:hypothetical protein